MSSTDVESDDMVNDWGCVLVNSISHGQRSPTAHTHQMDAMIRSAVKGYRWSNVFDSGSTANAHAIDRATDGDRDRCLVAMGSYVCGTGYDLQQLSSVSFSSKKEIGLIITPGTEDAEDGTLLSPKCIQQTVPMPYHIPDSGVSTEKLNSLEDRCLVSMEKKLLMAHLTGKPYKAFLLEYILSGNGGELSNRFLQKLGNVFRRYNIVVIADEIMTGGRIGPVSLTMTTEIPEEFRSLVKFITLGKMMGKGLLLEAASSRPTELDSTEAPRGTSTRIDLGPVYTRLRTVIERINNGRIPERRGEVLQRMNVDANEHQLLHWGRGCLIFTHFSRPQVNKNMKCRLLPKLESSKLRKLTTHRTKWSRKTVGQHLHSASEEWLEASAKLLNQENPPFLVFLLDHIIEQRPSFLRANDLLEHLGMARAEELASQSHHHKRCKKLYSYSYEKKPIALINDALRMAALMAPQFVKYSRKGNARRVVYVFDYCSLKQKEKA
jgi:hypothetical protein